MRAAELSSAQQNVQNAARQPVAKKRSSSANVQGSRLSTGTMHTGSTGSMVRRPQSPNIESLDSQMVYDPNTRRFIPKSQLPPPVPIEEPEPETGGVMSDSEVTASMRKKKKRPVVPAVQTNLEPPPRNPARLSPGASPSSPRAAGFLHKQPSIVREDPEEEERATESSPAGAANLQQTGKTTMTSAGPAKVYVAPSATHTRSASLDVPRSAAMGDRGRGSPGRAAHFSPSPISEGTRHVPPPRSISPVKSAMKHSPANSVRNSSPMAGFSVNGPKAPPSEASDTTSLASQDGLSGKKKKSARVSFDDEPREMVPAPLKPTTAKSVTRDRSPAVQDDMEEIMGPRPALPSFGSVRVRKSGTEPQMAEKVTESPPDRHEGASNDFAIASVIVNHHASKSGSDQPAAGGVASNLPLQPEVTSKEGTGYASDSDEEAFSPDASSTPAKAQNSKSQGSLVQDSSSASVNQDFDPEKDDTEVPAINLLPPTPGLDEEAKSPLGEDARPSITGSADQVIARVMNAPLEDRYRVSVPGGWDDDAPVSSAKDVVDRHATGPSLATVDVSEPSPAEDTLSTRVGSLPQTTERYSPQRTPELSAITEDDSDDSAAFSDAAEDLSDLEDGGFASLDAIVASPIDRSPTAPGTVISTPPDSPSAKVAKKLADRAAASGHRLNDSGDWTEATAYWSRLSKDQRQRMEREALSSDDEARPPPAAVKKPKKKKSAPKHVAVLAPDDETPRQPAPAQQQRPPQAQAQPRASAMKKSMRAPQGPSAAAQPADGDVHMRKSMRSGGAMRSSMRDGGQQTATRPQSAYVEPEGKLQKRNIRPQSAGQLSSNNLPISAVAAATLQKQQQQPQTRTLQSQRPSPSTALARQTTNDSDSESSFKKNKRRPSVSTLDSHGKYTMKRSMRAGSLDMGPSERRPTSPTPAGRGRGSSLLRSLSPNGSMMGRNRENLKQTMRGQSVDTGARTMRGQPAPRGDSKTRFGFGSSKPAKVAAAPAPAPTKSRFKSRFGDSDSEEEGGGRRPMFRSRFADSDDDEPASPVTDLAPVRGIPRRQGQDDGDSTDLEDEEEEVPRTKEAARNRQKAPKPGVPSQADIDKAMEAARRNVAAQGYGTGTSNAGTGNVAPSKEGGALEKKSLRHPGPSGESDSPRARFSIDSQRPEKKNEELPNGLAKEKKRGFLGSIMRRNRSSQASVPQVSTLTQTPETTEPVPQIPPQKFEEEAPQTPTRQPKLIRRASAQPKDATAPTSPLHAATSSQNSTNWPLPPPPKVTANGVESTNERPNTSDGIESEAIKLARTMRPDLMPRSASGMQLGGRTDGTAAGDSAIYSAKTGRKKKFPGLRRMFGLND